MISVPLQQVRALADERPAGYLDEVISSGRLVGDTVEIEDETHAALVRKYRPTLAAMTRSLASSLSLWISSGFPITPQAEYALRESTCRPCIHYTRDAWFHHCALCGCTSVKLHLATEQCPDIPPRWLRAPAAAPPP